MKTKSEKQTIRPAPTVRAAAFETISERELSAVSGGCAVSGGSKVALGIRKSAGNTASGVMY